MHPMDLPDLLTFARALRNGQEAFALARDPNKPTNDELREILRKLIEVLSDPDLNRRLERVLDA